MANLNRIILVGRLTADPESRSTNEGLPLAKFRLAVTRPISGKSEAGTDFIDVVAWRGLAEVCGQYLKKGRLVLVDGRIQNRSFEDQSGQRRWVTEVVARTMTMLEKSSVASQQSSVASHAVSSRSAHDAESVPEEELVDDADLASDLPF